MVKCEDKKIKISELVKAYTNNKNERVFCYDGKLNLRPEYAREYIWTPNMRREFIKSVILGYPLGEISVNKISDDRYDVIDGQQRLITICKYFNEEFPLEIVGKKVFYRDLDSELKNRFDNRVLSFAEYQSIKMEDVYYLTIVKNTTSGQQEKMGIDLTKLIEAKLNAEIRKDD